MLIRKLCANQTFANLCNEWVFSKVGIKFHCTLKSFIKGYRGNIFNGLFCCCFLPPHSKMLSGAKCASISLSSMLLNNTLHVSSVRVYTGEPRNKQRHALSFIWLRHFQANKTQQLCNNGNLFLREIL